MIKLFFLLLTFATLAGVLLGGEDAARIKYFKLLRLVELVEQKRDDLRLYNKLCQGEIRVEKWEVERAACERLILKSLDDYDEGMRETNYRFSTLGGLPRDTTKLLPRSLRDETILPTRIKIPPKGGQ